MIRPQHDRRDIRIGRALQPGVGNENILVGGALYLESARGVTNGGDFDEIIALPTGEHDRVAAVPVRAGTAIDVARDRCRSDLRVLERLAVGSNDLPTNDIDLLRRHRKCEGCRQERAKYYDAHDYLDAVMLFMVARNSS